MSYDDLKEFIKKWNCKITLQTAAKLFRETNNCYYSWNEAKEITTKVFNDLGIL